MTKNDIKITKLQPCYRSLPDDKGRAVAIFSVDFGPVTIDECSLVIYRDGRMSVWGPRSKTNSRAAWFNSFDVTNAVARAAEAVWRDMGGRGEYSFFDDAPREAAA